jgi:hypothetical protein
MENFRIAAGIVGGSYGGMPFQDSDVAKWIEAASYANWAYPNADIEKAIDEAVDIIAAAQEDDGYLNTYFTLAEPGKRWTDFAHGHELYCAGHLIEAAVAIFEATGKRKLLDVAERYVAYIDSVIGPQPGKLRVYCGHPEIELALARLYRVTGKHEYLCLLGYFIEERGRQPCFLTKELTFGYAAKDRWFDLSYHQAHAPIRDHEKLEGHAVRAMYLYSGVADLTLETGDASLRAVLERLWQNLVSARMYVTGGVGSQAHGERFTVDFDLPNDRAYAESCASIGLAFWAQRMFLMEADGSYGDVFERALYNGVLAGISLSGTEYFYVNPLRVDPESARYRSDLSHVATERQKWFGVACCPTNIARFICSLGRYVYSSDEDTLYVHLFVESEAALPVSGGIVRIRQETGYPWTESVAITLDMPDGMEELTLAIRLPSWCENPSLTINGDPSTRDRWVVRKGYARLLRRWLSGDRVRVDFTLPVVRVVADPRVADDAGRIALQRGPVVYCLEEIDNGAGLDCIALSKESRLVPKFDPDLLGGIVTISAQAIRSSRGKRDDFLYGFSALKATQCEITAVPYGYWCNRRPGEMIVWIREY